MSKLNSNRLGKTTYLEGIVTQDVLKACIAGHRESQELLYHYFSPKMFGICLNKLHMFRYEGSFEGWMKRIFVNTSIEHYRKASNRKFFVEIDNANEIVYDNTVVDNLATQDLLKVVQKLPDGYRTVFNLYAIEGYNHKEIGKMLGISEGTSKSQLARARATLQRNIKSLK